MQPLIRRALAFLLPLVVLATLACGLVYAVAQQSIRQAANDPQIQVAEDAARSLDAGASPASLVGGQRVDVASSLAVFLVITDAAGNVVATDGDLDGGQPVPPPGIAAAARPDAPDTVTWQPRAGVRIAQATVPWRGGAVLAGRSLREAERREDLVLWIVGAAWVAMLVALGVASLVAARLWPAPAPPRA